jgi:hypothetical protein
MGGRCCQKRQSDEQQQQSEGEPEAPQVATPSSTGSTINSKVSGTGLKTEDKKGSKPLPNLRHLLSMTGSKIGSSTDSKIKSSVGSQSGISKTSRVDSSAQSFVIERIGGQISSTAKLSNKLKREWSDRLLQHFKNNLNA